MFGGIKGNKNWRTRCNKDIMQLFGDSHILSLARKSRLDWIRHVSRKGSQRKFSQVVKNNPHGSRPSRR